MKISYALPLALLLGGCATLQGQNSAPVIPVEETESVEVALNDKSSLCLVEESKETFEHQCDLLYWVDLWVRADNTEWPVRKKAIQAMDNTTEDKIKKIVLSLPVDTPYQDRLRAQHWLKELSGTFNPKLQNVIDSIVAAPNGEMLELESAMVVLNRVKTGKEEQVETLQEELASLKKKMAELLEIEASLMDKNRSTQQ